MYYTDKKQQFPVRIDKPNPVFGKARPVRRRNIIIAFLTISAAILLTTSAFAESVTEKTGVNSALGVAPSTADFVKEAVSSDMFEIKSSKLAVARTDGTTKEFAQKMVTAHQKTTDELKSLVSSGKVKATLPTAMSDAHAAILNDLTDAKGDEFIKAYHSDQVDAHEDAVNLFKRYAEEGENAELKAWAKKTLPTLQKHLEMAQQLDK